MKNPTMMAMTTRMSLNNTDNSIPSTSSTENLGSNLPSEAILDEFTLGKDIGRQVHGLR